jgi:lysophospholipase L1-like esterase
MRIGRIAGMFLGVRRFLCLALACAAFLSACAQTPTAPSAAPTGVAVGEVPQTSVPVPPRISIAPPRGIGLTRYVAFGDSITWGAISGWDPRFLFAAANGGYVERLKSALDQHHAPQRFTVINEGVPGEFATYALPRFRSMLTSQKPQAVLLLEGVNDLNNDVPVSDIVAALRQMSDAARAVGVPVLLATMYQTYPVTDPMGQFRPNGAENIKAFNSEIRAYVSGRSNLHLVDLYAAINKREYVGADGLHLTDAGFEIVASVFMDRIEEAFPVRGSFQ